MLSYNLAPEGICAELYAPATKGLGQTVPAGVRTATDCSGLCWYHVLI